MLVDLDRYISGVTGDAHFVIANESAQYVQHFLACDEEHCIFECDGTLSCAVAAIYVNGTSQTDVIISCSASFACLSTLILDESLDSKLNVVIICSGRDSCHQLTVNLTKFDSFNLHCIDTGSCEQATINLNFDDKQIGEPTDFGVIHCILASVCNDLVFNTNSERSQLIMYEFSRGIVLNNEVGYSSADQNILCNINRWIQFDGLLETDTTVIESVNNEYIADSLPCEDVSVQCGNKSCVMTYNYIGSDIVQKLNNISDLAFSVNVADLYTITCNGQCVGSPTEQPTEAPTHAPTSMYDFDHYILAKFEVRLPYKTRILNTSTSISKFTGNVTHFISAAFDRDAKLSFSEVWVNISEINEFEIHHLLEHPYHLAAESMNPRDLSLESFIKCREIDCNYICCKNEFDIESFRNSVEIELQKLYGDGTTFSVNSVSEPFELYPISPEIPIIFVIVLCIIMVLLMIAICGCIFNEGFCCVIKPCHTADNGKWLAVIAFAFQFYDFVGDINFSAEAWYFWKNHGDDGHDIHDTSHDTKLLIVAIGSTTFVVIPYLFNLCAASMIKGERGVVSNNMAAQIWFTNYAAIFIFFVLFSGSSYTAIEMISSNLFGLYALNCGLTQYELKKLFHFKVFNNVMLENLPQIFLLWLFSDATGGMTPSAWFSFFGSVTSVIGTLLKYLIDRDHNDNLHSTEYYLALQVDRSELESPCTHDEDAMISGSMLTLDETKKITKNRGKTLTLSRAVAQVLKIESKSIEIGCTVLTEQGAVTHVVHHLDKTEFELFASEFECDSEVSHVTQVTPHFYLRRVYGSLSFDISRLMRDHFGVDDRFKVLFLDPIERKRRIGVFDGDKMDMERVRSKTDGTLLERMKRAVTFGNLEQSRRQNLFPQYLQPEDTAANLEQIVNGSKKKMDIELMEYGKNVTNQMIDGHESEQTDILYDLVVGRHEHFVD